MLLLLLLSSFRRASVIGRQIIFCRCWNGTSVDLATSIQHSLLFILIARFVITAKRVSASSTIPMILILLLDSSNFTYPERIALESPTLAT